MTDSEIIDKIHDSSISMEITSFWDETFAVKHEKSDNATTRKTGFKTFSEAVQWLAESAAEHNPETKFSRWWEDVEIAAMIMHDDRLDDAKEDMADG